MFFLHQLNLLTEINERAFNMGRNLKIYLGIPADDVYEKFLAQA